MRRVWGIALRGFAVCALAFVLAIGLACGDDDDGDGATPAPLGTGSETQALNIFISEAVKSNWFAADDDITFETEELLWLDAAVRAAEIGLPIYATEPGPPPYEDGLPGTFVVAEGDFYDYPGELGTTPPPDTGRREAIAIAFVDELGRISYSYRFTDGEPPSTATPTD